MGMIFLSDEDTDVKNIVNSWISKYSSKADENEINTMKQCMDEIFFPTIDYCVRSGDLLVDTSLVGCVLNGLVKIQFENSIDLTKKKILFLLFYLQSMLRSGVTNRLEFAVKLFKGLAGNINETSREGLAKEIFGKVGQSPPGRKSQSIYYNKSRDRLDVYESDVNGQDLKLSDFKSDSYPGNFNKMQ